METKEEHVANGVGDGVTVENEVLVSTDDICGHDDGPPRPPRKVQSPSPPVPPRTWNHHMELIQRLQRELEDSKNMNAIAQTSWKEELQKAERRYQEELQTLQALMQENVQEAVRSTKQESENQLRRLRTAVNKLELELSSCRASEKDSNNVFFTMKSLAKKVGNLTPNMLSASSLSALSSTLLPVDGSLDKEYLDRHMERKSTGDDDMLHSIIGSMSEEITLLKDKLRIQDEQLQMYEASQVNLVRGVDSVAELLKGRPIDQILGELSAKIGQVSEPVTVGMNLADLELYVAMLTTQKVVLLEDKERLKGQVRELKEQLETESLQHSKLKKAWTRAHDQYIVQQRTQLQEIRRLKNSFSTDQPMPESKKDRRDFESSVPEIDIQLDSESVELRPKKSSKGSLKPESVASNETSSLLSSTSSTGTSGSVDLSGVFGSSSPCSSRSDPDEITRVVSEEQWQLLQDELKSVRGMASQACSSCLSLRPEYDRLQADKSDLETNVARVEAESERLRKELTEATKMFRECEEKWLEGSRESERQVDALYNDQSELIARYEKLYERLQVSKKEMHLHVRDLMFDRVAVSRKVNRLQEENDRLVGKHLKTSAELNNEDINLPLTVDELQEEMLKMRDELIIAKIGKENAEDKMETEVNFFKEDADRERLSRLQREEELSAEINSLREELGSARSYQTHCDEAMRKNDSLQLTLDNLKFQVRKLMEQLHDLQREKQEKENDISDLKGRISSLQSEITTSEEVQRDFVKLSQTLQMQLEAIRQAEKEVRWQHEDDAAECPTCKHGFSMMKKKHRCKHCGHIFCGECLKYTVSSGPHRRPAKVCNVCYYLLVPESTPFFGQS